MGPGSPGLGKGCTLVGGHLPEGPPPRSPPAPSAAKPSTPACPASRPIWPAAARSVSRPSRRPGVRAWCSQLPPRGPHPPGVRPCPCGARASAAQDARRLQPQPSVTQSWVVLPMGVPHLCWDSPTWAWGKGPLQRAATLPGSTCLFSPSPCFPPPLQWGHLGGPATEWPRGSPEHTCQAPIQISHTGWGGPGCIWVLLVLQGPVVGANLQGLDCPVPSRGTTWWGSTAVCCVPRSSAPRVASSTTSSRPTRRCVRDRGLVGEPCWACGWMCWPHGGAGKGRGVRVAALHLSEWATLRNLLVSFQSSLRLP